MSSLGTILKGAANIVTGSLPELIEDVVGIVRGQIREKMSEGEQAQIELQIREAAHKHEVEKIVAWNEQEKQFQEFVSQHEGTASDLKAIPILGHIMIFVRGCLRPLVTLVTLYADIQVLSGGWKLTEAAGGDAALASQYSSMLWIINIVVLVFLFGERGIKNVMPLVEGILLAKKNVG